MASFRQKNSSKPVLELSLAGDQSLTQARSQAPGIAFQHHEFGHQVGERKALEVVNASVARKITELGHPGADEPEPGAIYAVQIVSHLSREPGMDHQICPALCEPCREHLVFWRQYAIEGDGCAQAMSMRVPTGGPFPGRGLRAGAQKGVPAVGGQLPRRDLHFLQRPLAERGSRDLPGAGC